MAVRELRTEIAGLDALEMADTTPTVSPAARVWRAVWPKLTAVALALAAWQAVVWSGWRDPFVLPGPVPVGRELGRLVQTGDYWHAIGVTMTRGLVGFAIAVVIGAVLGIAVSRIAALRAAAGSLITGLQTMPSIAWFPLAILLFQLGEKAIAFVIVLGAAPSVANGVITGVDYVPRLLLNAGRSMGAGSVALYRYVVLPAALPSVVAGLKQGWSFAWRSLMAGELLVVIAERPALGQRLQFARELQDTPYMIAIMVTILVIGIVVDTAFTSADRAIRRRWGLLDATT